MDVSRSWPALLRQRAPTSCDYLTSATPAVTPAQTAGGERLREVGRPSTETRAGAAEPGDSGFGWLRQDWDVSWRTALSFPKPVCPSVTGLHLAGARQTVGQGTRTLVPTRLLEGPQVPRACLGGAAGTWWDGSGALATAGGLGRPMCVQHLLAPEPSLRQRPEGSCVPAWVWFRNVRSLSSHVQRVLLLE